MGSFKEVKTKYKWYKGECIIKEQEVLTWLEGGGKNKREMTNTMWKPTVVGAF